jgi:DNA-binding PadR family transcriptional regulator
VYGVQYTIVEVIVMADKKEILKNLFQELRKGTLVLGVLSQLQNKHYGYSLVESLNEKGLQIDQNTLYPLLRRLDSQGLLVSTWEVMEPRPRKYYQLSDMGIEVLNELKEEYYMNYQIINALLKEEK